MGNIRPDIPDFLRKYPGMKLGPVVDNIQIIEGLFRFNASPMGDKAISDSFEIKIHFPLNFPTQLPVVFETGGRIPPFPEYHVNSNNNSLCLGTDLRIISHLQDNPTLLKFTNKFLLAFFYAVSIKLKSGGKFTFGELKHGSEGIQQDYSDLLKLDNLEKIKHALTLLGTKKRHANKQKCPCGCEKRYGVCKYRFHLEKFRHYSNQKWFLAQANHIKI